MAWLVPLLPIVAAPILFLLGRAWSRAAWGVGATATSLGCLLLACLAVGAGWEGSYAWSDTVFLRLGMTPLSAVFIVTVPAIASAVIGFAAWHEKRSGLPRLLSLLLVFTGAMELLVLATDFLTLLIAWEIVGACSWALINHEWREEGNAKDAGWAFLVTRLGDLGLFLAVFVVFANTGSFSYANLASLDSAALSLFAAGLLLAAAAKSAQLPFSPWLFSAMAGPASVSALLHAATMVAAGVYILVRLHETLAAVHWFNPVVVGIGLSTSLAAGLVASSQFHAKKLLAASTSAHYGLMFIAIGAGYPAIAALHFVAHAAMKATLFLIAGVTGSSAGSYDLRAMRLGRALPMIAIASLITSLALAGMLPLGAAWTKEKIVTTAGHISPWLAVLTMVVGMLSALYAARFHFHAFGLTPGRGDDPHVGVSLWESAAVIALSLVTVVLSLLWLPGVAQGLETLLGVKFPAFKAWELVGSLALVVAGGAVGLWLTRRRRVVEASAGKWAAGWFVLPAVGTGMIMRPLFAGGRMLARIDDVLIDGAVTAVATGTRGLARLDSRLDEALFDRIPREAARATRWLAQVSSRTSEKVFDLLPEGSAIAAGKAGSLARQLQTGMSHHYYLLTAFGLALLVTILILGEVF